MTANSTVLIEGVVVKVLKKLSVNEFAFDIPRMEQSYFTQMPAMIHMYGIKSFKRFNVC